MGGGTDETYKIMQGVGRVDRSCSFPFPSTRTRGRPLRLSAGRERVRTAKWKSFFTQRTIHLWNSLHAQARRLWIKEFGTRDLLLFRQSGERGEAKGQRRVSSGENRRTQDNKTAIVRSKRAEEEIKAALSKEGEDKIRGALPTCPSPVILQGG